MVARIFDHLYRLSLVIPDGIGEYFKPERLTRAQRDLFLLCAGVAGLEGLPDHAPIANLILPLQRLEARLIKDIVKTLFLELGVSLVRLDNLVVLVKNAERIVDARENAAQKALGALQLVLMLPAFGNVADDAD